jgi:hypothetical protein
MPLAMSLPEPAAMNLMGVDFSYARPTADQIKTAGYSFVMRYLSWEYATPESVGKNITAAELQAYHAAGISVGFVWEAQPNDPEFGAPQGQIDGTEAGKQLAAMGVPKTVPVFWALDTDPAGDPAWEQQTTAYNTAFAAASGHPAWPYGSNQLIDFFGGGWQTQAWSNGAVSSHAFLLQYAGASSALADVDVNELLNAYALYPPNYTPPATDWFDMATETDLENAVRKVLNEGTLQGQPSWAHQTQAMMVIANKSYQALQTIAGGLVALKAMLAAIGAKLGV